MSETLHVVCIECREETTWGKPYHDGERWRVQPPRRGPELFGAFVLVHRGHVLGVVEGGTLDSASDRHGEIDTVSDLGSLQSAHPDSALDDADRLAEPSDLLQGLLGAES